MKRFESREWRDSMRLRVDYNNMMQEFVGMRGIGAAMLAEQRPQYKAAALRMEEKRGEMKWRQLPFNQSEVVHQILETAAWVRRNCDAFVVLGIGGSALGPICATMTCLPQSATAPNFMLRITLIRNGWRL